MAYKRRISKLNRTKGAREALLIQLALPVIEHGVIETSEARGKGLRVFFDRLMKGRSNGQDYGKKIAKVLRIERGRVVEILKNLEQIGEDKKSGFLRIVRLGKRGGDGSMRVRVELIKKKVEKVVKVDQVEKGRDVNT